MPEVARNGKRRLPLGVSQNRGRI